MKTRSKLNTKVNRHTIDELKKAGYKVFITHRRVWEPDVKWVDRFMTHKGIHDPWFPDDYKKVIVPHRKTPLRSFREAVELWGRENVTTPISYGGSTSVIITHPDGTEFEGVAPCSMMDRYNRKIGRSMALGRALKLLIAYENGELKAPEFED